MSTKKSVLDSPKKMAINVLNATKKAAKTTNEFALNATEDIVTESLMVTEQWQGVANTALKGGLKLASKQQDIFFNALTGVKSNYKLGKKRLAKLMA